MKTKMNILRVSCLLLTGFLISCSDSEEFNQKNIIGKWKPSSASITGCEDLKYNDSDTTIRVYPPSQGYNLYPSYQLEFSFINDSTWSYTEPGFTETIYPGCHMSCPPIVVVPYTVTGTYSISDHTITFNYDSGLPSTSYKLVVTDSKLILSIEFKFYYTPGCTLNYFYLKQ